MDAPQPQLTPLSAAAAANNNQIRGQPQGPTPTNEQRQRTSAPYGHACAGCARAKCKCIIGSRGGSCERCRRLGRACTPSATVRKRSTAASRRAAARDARGGSGGSSDNGNGNCTSGMTARLEEKLDDLVTLLRSQASTAAVGAGAGGVGGVGSGVGVGGVAAAHATTAATHQQAPTPDSTGDDQPQLRLRDVFPFTQLVGPAAANQVVVPPCHQDPDPGRAFAVPDHLEPRQSAEESLQIFREIHLRSFPFVYIPPETTANDLQRERPFLWLNIRTLTCKSPAQQCALSNRIREIIGQKVLSESERTMDLLLGLLGFLSWGWTQSAGRPFLVVFAGVAAGIVSDMRLDKPTHFNPYKELHAFKPYRFPYPPPSYSTHRTNEQRRATLACWVIGANILKSQHMRWTPHMEESLQKLADEPDWVGDQVLVVLVRVSRVLEEVSHVRWSATEYGGHAAATRPTPMYYVKALRANLDNIRRDLPPELVENRVILTYLYSAEAQINELGLQNPAPSSLPVSMDCGRTECFEGFLRATKLWLEKYFSFEPAEYIGFTISMFLFFSRLTQILYRLSVTEDPAWDRAAVRHSVDLIATLETGAARFAGVARAAGFEGDGSDGGDTFTRAAHALQATIPNWRAKLEQAGAIPVTAPAAGDNAGIAGAGETGLAAGDTTTVHESEFVSSSSVDQMQEFMPMDFADDPWITEFFAPLWDSPWR
ncbi:hypothetical protein DL767_009012 [Monosporascus sp. MG133]|nr:hypothetical protein DL767_009012 [Monosporascus sp. MG133]